LILAPPTNPDIQMRPEIIDAVVPILLALMLIELAWAWHRKRHPYRLADMLTNLSTSVGMQITGIAINALLFGAYLLLQYRASLPVWLGIDYLPAASPIDNVAGGWVLDWAQLGWWVLIFFSVDFAFYWFHRSAHEVNLLWATHIVHHSSESYNLSVGFRHSFVENLFSGLFYLPFAVLGVPWQMFLACYSINLIWQYWVHTEWIGRLGPLEWLFSTPSHHRVHHARNPQYIDHNYGGTFIIWDRLFGTFRPETERPVYGITKPLQHYSLFQVNFHAFSDMAQLMPRLRSWADRWRLLWARPGWLPSYLGGPQPIPDVRPGGPISYNPQLPRPVLVYSIAQFLLLAAGAGIVVEYSYAPHAQWQYLLFWSVAGLLSLQCIGGLLSGTRWGYTAEALRLMLTLFLTASFWLQGFYAAWGPAAVLGFGWLSLGVLGWLRLRYPIHSELRSNHQPAKG
jgi:sterol desaturase/sphingolipid hydroxylase (fatty acid hydroxylase superfamily)